MDTTKSRRKPLDEHDHAIVAVLASSPRASYAEIARRIGLSEAAVRSRVRRLFADGTIVVTARVDPAVLGVGTVAIAFAKSTTPLHEVARRVGELDDAVFVVATAGPFDMVVELRCRDTDHLLAALDDLRDTEGVDAIESCTVLHYYKQDWSAVGMPPNGRTPQAVDDIGRERESAVVDEIDRKLVAALIRDGRATYGSLARLVGLSHAAVRVRVLRLLEQGIVTVQLHTSKEAMGVGGFGGVGLVVDGPVQACAEDLARIPEVNLVAATSGHYDVLGEVWWFDEAHLLDVLDRIRTLPGVRSVETIVYLIEEKSDYTGDFLVG